MARDKPTLIPVVRELRELRKAAGLTQDEVADYVGTDNTALSRMERGHQKTPIDQAALYAERLGFELVLIPVMPDSDSNSVDVSRLNFADRLLLARLARVMRSMPTPAKRLLSAQVDIYEDAQDLSLVRKAD